MAIRFDKRFNKEIRRAVDTINKKFSRARKSGAVRVPQNISIRTLKREFSSRYASRAELRRTLNMYKKMSVKNLSKVTELETGQKISLASLQIAEQRRLRLYRKVRRDIRESEKRLQNKELPFNRAEISRLRNIESKLAQPARTSESRIRMITEMYSREYSGAKKATFETALFDTIDDHLSRIKLDDDPAIDKLKKAELIDKLEDIDIDDLIKMNREDEDMAEILDRYKGKDEYVDEDIAPIERAYRNIYDKIDSLKNIYES